MKIVTDHKLIKRNRKIGQITTFASMGILALGLYLSFQQSYISLSFFALVVGFALSQIGIFYGSRWGRTPRPDETLSAGLKGLDGKYTLYHYTGPVNHLLVGPAGVWILSPYFQKGTITYNEKRQRWLQKGGNLYMKIFAQEGIGRPEQEIQRMRQDLAKFLKKNLPENELPNIQAALVFTNENVNIVSENAPLPALQIKKLKDYLRRQAKENPIDLARMEAVENILPKEEIPAS